MSRITREGFKGDFTRADMDVAIDVKKMDSETLKKLEDAGIGRKELLKIAGKDGKITGDEYEDLYEKVESLEKDADHDSFETKKYGWATSASGKAYEALKLEFDRNVARTRAQGALKDAPAVPKKDSYRKHIDHVQADLKKLGITSAKGATIFVIGENDPNHASGVVRTIAGKVGLAKGADVRLQEYDREKERYIQNHRYTKEIAENLANHSTLTVKDFAKLGIVQYEAELQGTTAAIHAIRKNLPADGKTRIGNLSQGVSNVSVAGKVVAEMVQKLPPDHPIFKKAQAEWEMKNNVKYDPEQDDFAVKMELMRQVAGEMATLQNDSGNKAVLTHLQVNLQNEVDKSRKQGLLIFNAAGNDRDEALSLLGDPNASTNCFDSIKGLITVGAADLKSPKNASDDIIADFSATGKSIEIAAPGVDVPVGSKNEMKRSATSYASPYAASVAALMVAANPKITPDQIEEILTSGRVTTDLAGDMDGKGLLDPAKAVKEAKDLATK